MTKFNKIQLISSGWFEAHMEDAALNNHSRCICDLFARLLREEGFELPVGRGLVVSYYPVTKGNPYYLTDAGWHHLIKDKDIRSFIKKHGVDQKKYFIELIKESFLELNQYIDFDMSKVITAIEKVKSLNYENFWKWNGGRKFSPNRQWQSDVYIKHELEHILLVIKVINKRNENMLKKEIRVEESEELFIHLKLGKLKWLSNNELVIFPKYEDEEPITFFIESI